MSKKRKILISVLLLLLTGLLVMIGVTLRQFLSKPDTPPPALPEPVEETPEPEPAENPEGTPLFQLFIYENDRFAFLYNPSRIEISDEGAVVSAVPLDGLLPRMDFQTIAFERKPDAADFLFLSRMAFASYFARTPDADSITAGEVSTEDGFRVTLTVPATESSDALTAQVRLKDGVLAILLLPEAHEDADYWQLIWESVRINSVD